MGLIGVGWGAGSAHSSWDVVGLVLVVSTLRLWEDAGSGFRGVVSPSLVGENLNEGAEGDSADRVVGVVGSVAGVVGKVVGAACRCFSLRRHIFTCRISCRRRISWRRVLFLFVVVVFVVEPFLGHGSSVPRGHA